MYILVLHVSITDLDRKAKIYRYVSEITNSSYLII